ncbi:hypothetical protein AcV7_004245 [Taiwanofungus camphoratus]|nr:hypothetical protein AcV7_004245 [Antrodia cinnamomea]
MDNIHIVFEAPQEGHIRKKRARLVTSCDHCRLKKIKCTQSVNLSKCEACAAAQIPCRFRDREQYFAERGRVMSRGSPEAYDLSTASNRLNPQITMSILDSQQRQPSTPSTSHPADTDNTRSAKVATSPSTTNYSFVSSSDELQSPAPRSAQHSWQVGCDPSPLEVRPMGVVDRDYSIQGGSSQTTQPSRTESPLFDPRRTERPQPILMMHFIQIYFDRYGHSLPFLAYDETIRQFLEQSLSSLIANGIAALAAWFVFVSDFVQLLHCVLATGIPTFPK